MSTRDADPPTRVRREPPGFRRVAVRAVEDLNPRMRRIVLGGDELEGLVVDEPAASVRLLVPPPGDATLVMPRWTGNQFELPDGSRAPIRTFTPRSLDTERLELTIDVVMHGPGTAASWAGGARPGDEAAISGPGRGDPVDPGASGYLLAGDESAIPAIGQLLEALARETPVVVHVEVADAVARTELPSHPRASVTWHVLDAGDPPGDRLAAAVEAIDELPARVWIAGEAAAVQRLRKHLFDVRGRSRSTVTARGYWKQGRSAT